MRRACLSLGACALVVQLSVPPALAHSAAVFLPTQPWPLQPFWPLHSLLAVLQSDVPLQLLTPAHLTLPSSAACTLVATVPSENRAAAVVASARPDFRFSMIGSFRLVWVCSTG